MIADSNGVMPPELLIDADQQFLSDSLDRAALLVHGRHSHEGQPSSAKRRRLIASRQVEATKASGVYPNALLWNPAANSFEEAAASMGLTEGAVAVLGGPEIYRMFLRRYVVFHLSRVHGLRIPGGRAVFLEATTPDPGEALKANGLTKVAQQHIDADRGVTLETWVRVPSSSH